MPTEENARERREMREDMIRMSEEVSMLREARAAQDVMNDTLQDDVAKLTDAVQGLTSAIDKSRGALWVISGVSGTAGAVVAWLAESFLHKGS